MSEMRAFNSRKYEAEQGMMRSRFVRTTYSKVFASKKLSEKCQIFRVFLLLKEAGLCERHAEVDLGLLQHPRWSILW